MELPAPDAVGLLSSQRSAQSAVPCSEQCELWKHLQIVVGTRGYEWC